MQLLLNFILSAGIIILTLLIGLLIKGSKKHLSRRLLSIIFIGFFFVVVYTYGESNDIFWMYCLGFPIADTIGFLLGPLLFLYVQSLFYPETISLRQCYLHFIPLVLYFSLVSLPFLVSFIKDEYIFKYLNFIDSNEYILQVQAVFLFGYAVATLVKLNLERKKLKDHYSNLDKKDVNWISILLFGIIFLMLLVVSFELFYHFKGTYISFGDQLITITLITMVIWLAYFGTNQSSILLPSYETEGQKRISTNNSQKSANHHLANASIEEIKALELRLNEVLYTLQPFKDEDLSLVSLSSLIPTTDRKLSALLNHHLNTTFYDLINSCRVEYVKEKILLPEYDRFTFLAIAFEAGFSSKTSFNRIFKKITGMSPSAYKREKSKV